jgi:hypothetical protein
VVADVNSEWTPVEVDVASSCPEMDEIHGLTISRSNGPMDLVVDEIRFEP